MGILSKEDYCICTNGLETSLSKTKLSCNTADNVYTQSHDCVYTGKGNNLSPVSVNSNW